MTKQNLDTLLISGGELAQYDRLPGVVETSGFRKTSDDFTFTIATPRKYEEYAKSFMGRLSSLGVFLFAPCTPEEVDGLLKDGSVPRQRLALARTAPVEAPSCQSIPPMPLSDLAKLLNRNERTVQLLEEKGQVVRVSRGLYDRDRTIASLWNALKEAEQATGDEHRREKVLILREQRIKLEALNREGLGQLMNADKARRAIEQIGAEERQGLLNMPKTLGPQCDQLPGREIEIKLTDWVRRYLKDASSWDRIVGIVRSALDVIPTQDEQVKKRKKKKKK